jgi:hypothetical protein
MDDELAVLQVLRLKGRATAAEVAAATGVPGAGIAAFMHGLVASGSAREVREAYMLLPPARERLAALLDQERTAVDGDAVASVYDDFAAVNGDFKQLATDWQLRDGEPNDHSDGAYDAGVLARLPGIHERVMPVVDRAAGAVPRLATYGARLQGAIDRVQAGDRAWLLKPLIDSYHTVWFELHEELIGLSGRSREAEAAAGRAE